MWSHVVEEMVDCFHTMVGFTNVIESPWSCTVRRQVFLLDTDSGS